jgi:competence protein ComEC
MGALTFWKPWRARLAAALGKCETADKVGKAGQAWAWVAHWAKGSAPVDLFLTTPVFLAFGIGTWFGLQVEPALPFYFGLVAGFLVLAGLARFGPWGLRPLAVALACGAAGALACGARVWVVTAPMLAQPYYGPVQGRLVDIDRSQSDAIRLTLDQVVLTEVSPDQTPAKVRISLKGAPQAAHYEMGRTVLVTARLSAPESAAEPGGFDFRRMAWFMRLGAVGYTSSPVVTWAPPGLWDASINRLRNRLSEGIMARVDGDAGAFASGALTGDQSQITAEVVNDLRVSSLAHLLAISGMNMAFLTGFVFALIRYGLALVPPVALRINTKKAAAILAFGVALFYLVLSGANVATTRAFLMVSLLLGAVLLDRRVLSLRSVALAALILLIWQPESLLAPGFQLSFAATIALVVGYAPAERTLRARGLPPWLIPLAMVIVTSGLAGLATAPFSAATFNRMTAYGLLANLLTVPVMSVLMGAGAVAALLAPVGLAAPALMVMGWAAQWILAVAHWNACLNGAITPVPQPGPWVIPLISLGALWAILWQGRARLLGLAPLALALGLWVMVERPVLLISSDGVLAGVLRPHGRALSASRGAGFAAESWLTDDGDLALQGEAALREGFTGGKTQRAFQIKALRGVVLSGKEAGANVAAACAVADIVVLPERFGPTPVRPTGCTVIDATTLSQSGALAGVWQGDALLLVPVHSGTRIWSGVTNPVAPWIVRPKAASLAALPSRPDQ